ncbi:MAG: tRNA (adenosine(37)-N6)-threonylcarbamoyltransferase complex ATPase subunit type 1 TsaE [Treponema sp.]|nr:tRNA (adenosine(37)-N6)-threonylcarbamoyltransferase complex ATPase subunit type 1 TsaE [Treponema sp.]
MNLKQQADSPISGTAGGVFNGRQDKKLTGKLLSKSPEDTVEVGRQIASLLEAGSILALNGNLGSGKTCLAKGIADGLGIKENITSPTYTIVNEYQNAAFPFYHIDAYRLNNEKEFEDIGGKEIMNQGGICVIEWSGKIQKSLPENIINVNLEITGSQTRLILIEGLAI